MEGGERSASSEDDKSCIPLDVAKETHSDIESEYVHNLYEAIAPHFSHTRYNPWPGVVKYIKDLEPCSTVLDVGCGNGKYLELRNDLCFIGADRCMALLELAQNAKQANLLRCDCLALPFVSDTADLTLSIAVIHHLASSDQRKAAVAEMLRCTKPGGKLVIYVWAREQKERTTGYRKFESGDLLVPWHVQRKYYRGTTSVKGTASTSGAIKLYRYYHVFTRSEVEELESIDFEANNWILTLLKL